VLAQISGIATISTGLEVILLQIELMNEPQTPH
jgi:hypothetical protein